MWDTDNKGLKKAVGIFVWFGREHRSKPHVWTDRCLVDSHQWHGGLEDEEGDEANTTKLQEGGIGAVMIVVARCLSF